MIRAPHAWTLSSSFMGLARRLSEDDKQEITRLGAEISKINAPPDAHKGEKALSATTDHRGREYAEYELFDSPGRTRAAAAEDWGDMKLIKLRLIPEQDAGVALEGLTEHYCLLASLFLHLCCVEGPDWRSCLDASVTFDVFVRLGVDAGLVTRPSSTRPRDAAIAEGSDEDETASSIGDDDGDDARDERGDFFPEIKNPMLGVAARSAAFAKAPSQRQSPDAAADDASGGFVKPKLKGANTLWFVGGVRESPRNVRGVRTLWRPLSRSHRFWLLPWDQ
jgi:hypothetical protein